MLKRALVALAVLCGASLAEAAVEEPAGIHSTPPRLGYVEGEVLFWRPGAGDWEAAQVNIPLAAGDALATRSGKLEIQIGAKSFIRAADDTQLRLESNEPDFLQVEVSAGRVAVDARDMRRGAVQIDTPNGSVTIARDGYYRVDVDADATRLVVRRGGRATLTPAGGSAFDVATGEAIEVTGTATAQFSALAAPPFDDWDRWNYDRADRYLAAPRSYAVAEEVYGVDELDRHGDWRYVNTYGRVWVPSGVSAGWAPYTNGRWLWDPLYGWSWADYAPWGWAPYHYGRWVYAGYWAWAPGPVLAAPIYSPALVAFFGGPGISVGISVPFVSWVALGWGEPLIPWWGGVGFIGSPCWWGWGGPRVVNNIVINNGDVVNGDVINIYRNQNVPGAMVGVPKDQFDTRNLTRARVAGLDSGKLEPLRGALPVSAKGNAAVGGAKQGMPNLTGLRQGGAQSATRSGDASDFNRGGNQPGASGGDFARGAKPGAALRAGAGSSGDTKPGASTFDALRQRGGGAAASNAPDLTKPSQPSLGSNNLRRGQSSPSLETSKPGASQFDALRQRGAGASASTAPDLTKPSQPSLGSSNLRRGQSPPSLENSKPGASQFDALRRGGAGSASNAPNLNKPSAPSLGTSNLRRGASPPSLGNTKGGSSVFDTLRQRGAGSATAPGRANLSKSSAPSAGATNLRRGASPPSLPSGRSKLGAYPSAGSRRAGNQVSKPSMPRLSSARRADVPVVPRATTRSGSSSAATQRLRGASQRPPNPPRSAQVPEMRRGAPSAPSRRVAEARVPQRSADKPSTSSARTYRGSQYSAAAPAPAPSANLRGFSRGMGGGSYGGSGGSLSRGGGGMANFGRSSGMGGGGRGGGGALGSAKLGR